MVLLLAFLNLSCNQDDFVESQIENISGEELFKSILFVDGDATKNIPSLHSYAVEHLKLSDIEKREYRLIQSEIIDHLKEKDFNFFQNFKNDIMSKNPEVISNQLNDASMKILDYLRPKLQNEGVDLDLLIKEYNSDAPAIDNSENCGLVFLMAGVIAVAIVAVGVLAAAITITKTKTQDIRTLGKGINPSLLMAEQPSLSKDLIIAEIINM